MPRPSLWPVLSILVLSLIWGYNWVVMKTALTDCPPLLFAALRVLGGAILLFLILKAMRKPLARPPLGYILPLGLLQSTGFVGCTLWALEFGGAGKTAIIVYMMPIWLILMAWPLLGERVHGLQWPAMAFAALGLSLILEPWHIHSSLWGPVLALFSGLFWAASAVWQKLKAPPGLDLLDATAWQMIFGGVALLVIAIAVDPLEIRWTPVFAATLFYNAVPGNALAWLLWSYSLNRLPSGVAGMGTLLAPLVGVLASWGQLGERPGAFEGAGMILIFSAMILVTWQHLKPKETIPPPAAQE